MNQRTKFVENRVAKKCTYNNCDGSTDCLCASHDVKRRKAAHENRSSLHTLEPFDEVKILAAIESKCNQHVIIARIGCWEDTWCERSAATVEDTAVVEQNRKT